MKEVDRLILRIIAESISFSDEVIMEACNAVASMAQNDIENSKKKSEEIWGPYP